MPDPTPRPPSAQAAVPRTVRGLSPDGVDCEVGTEHALVVFLTSSCLACLGVWEALACGGYDAVSRQVAVVAVTPDATLEDARRVAALAPAQMPVVMASDLWHAHVRGPAPWVAHWNGGAEVSAGPAASWEDVCRHLPGPDTAPGVRSGRGRRARWRWR